MIDEERIAARMPVLHRISGRALLVLSGYMLVYGGWKYLSYAFSDHYSYMEVTALMLQILLTLWFGMFGLWVVSGRRQGRTDGAVR